MLEIIVPDNEYFDEEKEIFVKVPGQKLKLEHSLVSLTKWEEKWHKPFLHTNKTAEEILDYVKCMTITQNVDSKIYYNLTPENLDTIIAYIDNPMTATTINENGGTKGNKEIVTAEIIYYWMISLAIPVEFQKWHLNKLLTLIKVCSIKNAPAKKMSKKQAYDRHKALNAARRKKK